MDKKIVIGIIGLGYVGLPIFARLKKNFKCIGFDIDKSRIRQLKTHEDYNKEFKSIELKEKNNSIYTHNLSDLKECNFYIVTVPTPIFKNKKPNLEPLHNACLILKRVISNNDIIFLESTVSP